MIFPGIVLEVGILHHHIRRGHFGKAGAQRGAFALIVLMLEQFHPRVPSGNRLQHRPGLVPRSVIHDHHFLNRSLRQHLIQHLRYSGAFVKNRYHYRKAGRNLLVGFISNHGLIGGRFMAEAVLFFKENSMSYFAGASHSGLAPGDAKASCGFDL